MRIRDHLFPTSPSEAIEMLLREDGKARLIAGGTDLILEIRDHANSFEALVDVSRIPGLDRIHSDGERIHLGPLVTMTQVEESLLLKQHAIALWEACSWVGGPQIRNRATLAGNIVSAQPAADGAIALVALNAGLKILGFQGERDLMLSDSYIGVGRSAIDASREMITCIEFEGQHQGEASAFRRMAQRKAMALPQLNCAVWIASSVGYCTNARIAVGPVATMPFRARQAEAYLVGKPLTDETITACAAAIQEEVQPRDSMLRGSGLYRKEMAEALARETIKLAISRLEGSLA
ncbi:MAG: FAD binding domain-containing protein [Coprothermobacterota bacterium]|nr:FAD binding domain-containing protein [Coprothermobacterota bacterium]